MTEICNQWQDCEQKDCVHARLHTCITNGSCVLHPNAKCISPEQAIRSGVSLRIYKIEEGDLCEFCTSNICVCDPESVAYREVSYDIVRCSSFDPRNDVDCEKEGIRITE